MGHIMEPAVETREDFLSKNPTWALDCVPNGTQLDLGDTMSIKRYLDILDAIADQGPYAFYTKPVAESTINTIQAARRLEKQFSGYPEYHKLTTIASRSPAQRPHLVKSPLGVFK
jgi:gamma-glutamyltranspeptidase